MNVFILMSYDQGESIALPDGFALIATTEINNDKKWIYDKSDAGYFLRTWQSDERFGG